MAPHVVVAPAVQLVIGSRAHFLETDAVVPEGVAEADIERLVADGLIAEYVAPEPEEVEASVSFSQADVDAAVKAAEDAKDAELAQLKSDLEAARASLEELSKKTEPAAKAGSSKTAAPAK